jgi:hypothetical protein
MEKEQESSFICYNCNEKNYFDREKYLGRHEEEVSPQMKSSEPKVKEVSIECKTCREINSIKIEF